MLKMRVLTAAVLIPLVVAALLYLSTPVVAVSAGVVFLLAAIEWAKLMPGSTKITLPIMLLFTLMFGYCGWHFIYTAADGHAVPIANLLIMPAIAWWLLAIPLLSVYPRWGKFWCNSCFGIDLGLLILLAAWWSIKIIHSQIQGAQLLLFTFVVVWAADIGAYFAGKNFGKHKLAPAVSPGKTWEGVVGAFLGVGVSSALYAAVVLPMFAWHKLMLIALFLTPITIVGDLHESAFKRVKGVKDSGTIFPGHGGLIDRIDSLIATLPFAALLFTVGITNTASIEFPSLFNWLRSFYAV
jgi:phosphatidate cytidylyltransferase